MRAVTIANTDVQVSRLGFGTSRLHHEFSRRARLRLLATARDQGFTHFDTAPSYGEGLAEGDLGLFARDCRAQVTIATKVGIYPGRRPATHAMTVFARKGLGRMLPVLSRPIVDWSIKRAAQSLRHSLTCLRTDWIDFLFLHEPVLSLVRTDEYVDWIGRLKQSGTIRACGVAGEPGVVSGWVDTRNPLAQVVQTRDSIDGHEADFLRAAGREFQFTYGYIANWRPRSVAMDPLRLLSVALARNTSGAVLLSTSKAERLAQLGRVAA